MPCAPVVTVGQLQAQMLTFAPYSSDHNKKKWSGGGAFKIFE
jgi:hypothetical protein